MVQSGCFAESSHQNLGVRMAATFVLFFLGGGLAFRQCVFREQALLACVPLNIHAACLYLWQMCFSFCVRPNIFLLFLFLQTSPIGLYSGKYASRRFEFMASVFSSVCVQSEIFSPVCILENMSALLAFEQVHTSPVFILAIGLCSRDDLPFCS